MRGVKNLHPLIQTIDNKLNDGYWKEAKNILLNVIIHLQLHIDGILNKNYGKNIDGILDDNPYTNTKPMEKFDYFNEMGFKLLDYFKRNDEKFTNCNNESFIYMKNFNSFREELVMLKTVDSSFQDALSFYEKNIEKFSKNWRIRTWDDFFTYNLPFWLRFPLYRKIKALISRSDNIKTIYRFGKKKLNIFS